MAAETGSRMAPGVGTALDLGQESLRTTGARFSAGWVSRSSSSTTKPFWAMAGCVEQSQPKSTALPARASAISAPQAASDSFCSEAKSMPYCSSAPLHSGLVSHSGGKPKTSWSATGGKVAHGAEAQLGGRVRADHGRVGVLARRDAQHGGLDAEQVVGGLQVGAIGLAVSGDLEGGDLGDTGITGGLGRGHVVAEAGAHVLGRQVDLALLEGGRAIEARAQAELPVDAEAGRLERLGVDLRRGASTRRSCPTRSGPWAGPGRTRWRPHPSSRASPAMPGPTPRGRVCGAAAWVPPCAVATGRTSDGCGQHLPYRARQAPAVTPLTR